MADGRWEMGDGKWEMGNGRWKMGNVKWEWRKSNLIPSFILSLWGPSSGLMSIYIYIYIYTYILLTIYKILQPSLFSASVNELFQGKGRSLATYLHPYLTHTHFVGSGNRVFLLHSITIVNLRSKLLLQWTDFLY